MTKSLVTQGNDYMNVTYDQYKTIIYKQMKKIIILIFVFLTSIVTSQEDLMDELDKNSVIDSTVISSFFGLKIVNLESTKTASKGDFYFNISHRFGSVKDGISELFGLDQSNIRFSFFYGINDWLTLGASRSSYNKTYDITAKYRLKQQVANGFPLTITGFSEIAANTKIDEDDYPGFAFKNRLSYLTEVLISRKFSEKLSLQIAPIFIHENFVLDDNQDNSQFALGGGGRYKLNGTLSINVDYVYHFNRANGSNFNNPLSFGLDIETGGHVFQIIISNSNQLNDINFITNATGDWGDGDIYLGFNLYRVF